MNIMEESRIENAIGALWLQGKSGQEIEKILGIKFTWKNKATGDVISIADISRCMKNGFISWEKE